MDPKLHYPASITCFPVIYFLISLRISKRKIKPAIPLTEGVVHASHQDQGFTDTHLALRGHNFLTIIQPISRQAGPHLVTLLCGLQIQPQFRHFQQKCSRLFKHVATAMPMARPTGKDSGGKWQVRETRCLPAEISPACNLRSTGCTVSSEMSRGCRMATWAWAAGGDPHGLWRGRKGRCPVWRASPRKRWLPGWGCGLE